MCEAGRWNERRRRSPPQWAMPLRRKGVPASSGTPPGRGDGPKVTIGAGNWQQGTLVNWYERLGKAVSRHHRSVLEPFRGHVGRLRDRETVTQRMVGWIR